MNFKNILSDRSQSSYTADLEQDYFPARVEYPAINKFPQTVPHKAWK